MGVGAQIFVVVVAGTVTTARLGTAIYHARIDGRIAARRARAGRGA